MTGHERFAKGTGAGDGERGPEVAATIAVARATLGRAVLGRAREVVVHVAAGRELCDVEIDAALGVVVDATDSRAMIQFRHRVVSRLAGWTEVRVAARSTTSAGSVSPFDS